MTSAFYRTLARDAARRYPGRDRYARHFAFGKLTRDPAFQHLLAHGLIPPGSSVLDLGCGQGVLGALLLASRERHAAGDWPSAWPAPPNPRALRGIDFLTRDVERARHAAGDAGEFVAGDIRSADFGRADAVVILDVLHYLDYPAQDAVLERVRSTLVDGGVLLLRVSDASASLRFRFTLGADRLTMALRGLFFPRLWCRPLAEWLRRLAELGFEAAALPMSAGTPFTNVLLVARYHRR